MIQQKFTYGLHRLTDSCYAFIQPDGSWGLNNCGLIVHGNKGILIDTLYDTEHTRKMLAVIYGQLGNDFRIDTIINTHGNGDHWFGNSLINCGRIIATEKTLAEMKSMPPSKMALFGRVWWLLGGAGRYFQRSFGNFRFGGIVPSMADKTFTGSLNLRAGELNIRLQEFENTHTDSDLIVVAEEEKIVFAGDILFADSTPLTWTYPLGNWVEACDRILAMDVDIIVPGHGPVTDKGGLEKQKDYFLFLYEQVRPRFDKGLSPLEAALDIDLGEYGKWGESERIVFNVYSIYRELDPGIKELSAISLFKMADAYLKRI